MKSTLLKPLYKKAVSGLPVIGTPEDVVRRFSNGSAEDEADRLIGYYTSLAGATGFVGGLPGFLLMPITLPANMAGVALIQLHMSASLALMGGRDLGAADTRDECIDCLLEKISERGKNTEEEEVASRTAVKLGERAVRLLVAGASKLAGRAARSYALRKLGARRIPLFGGFLGAGTDAYVTRYVGRCAKETFLA